MQTIAVLGAGKIGAAVATMLRDIGDYNIVAADRDPQLLAQIAGQGVATVELNVHDDVALTRVLDGCAAVVCAVPYTMTMPVVRAAVAQGVHYFDLTEDVATAREARRLAVDARSILMPQCGLAPGFVSVVAMDLARRFETLESIHMRVGALPLYPTNSLTYNLTWSTDGLINEYCNPCDAIHEGRLMQVLPLEQVEHFSLDGVRYEAFNTSGGLGTLCDTLAGRVQELNYKTVRYPGHCELMRLLCNELRLGSRRALFKEVLEAAIPVTTQDVVLVFVSVTGMRNGRLTQESHVAKIYSHRQDGIIWSAIQLTTAASVCTMVDLLAQGQLPDRGLVRQEDVPLDAFLNNRFGRVYASSTRGGDVNLGQRQHPRGPPEGAL